MATKHLSKIILDWLVDDISSMVEEFVVITNHKFAEHFHTRAVLKPYKITVIDDGTTSNETRLGAVRDIQFAIDRLPHNGDDCLVMAGDNVLEFSLQGFIRYAQKKKTSCVMCHEENDLAKQQRTAIITMNEEQQIISYEEKPQNPKGNHAVPPFYYYRAVDLKRIPEALEAGCNYDAPGNFAAWLSKKATMYAYVMPGKRYDIGDMKSYREVQERF